MSRILKRVHRYAIMSGKHRAARAKPYPGELPPEIAEAKAKLIAAGVAPLANGSYVLFTDDGNYLI